MRIITLTTDFGHRDPFAGIMKGVILSINPEAGIVDLSHGVPPQDIVAGALVLSDSVPHFPAGTIHVAVVDPGVGSARRALLIEAEKSFFIGPDNGIFSLVLRERTIRKTIELSNPAYHLRPTSATFHGRDIFAPAAAYLSLGMPAEELGSPTDEPSGFSWPEPSKGERSVEGEVIYIDGFGNLITNIREVDLPAEPSKLVVSLGSIVVHGLVPSYAWRKTGEYVGLINSSSLLEIALANGSAQSASGIPIGTRVTVRADAGERP
jgi:S-adenosylmethionine hydrolase